MTATPTRQIKGGSSGDLLLRLYRTIHAYVSYFPDLFRDARKRKKEKKKGCSPVFIRGNPLCMITGWLLSSQPSLPLPGECKVHSAFWSQRRTNIWFLIFHCFLLLMWIIVFILIFIWGWRCWGYVWMILPELQTRFVYGSDIPHCGMSAGRSKNRILIYGVQIFIACVHFWNRMKYQHGNRHCFTIYW